MWWQLVPESFAWPGLFLGLTGVHINGREAVEIGMADRMVDADADSLLDALAEQNLRMMKRKIAR